MTKAFTLYSDHELAPWYCPNEHDIPPGDLDSFRRAKACLIAALTGVMSPSRAAATHGLCRKRLKRMINAAPCMNADGMPNGFRVCVPWGTYALKNQSRLDVSPPRKARPGAMQQLLLAIPVIKEWVECFGPALPPGRPPKAFDRLHQRICAEMRSRDLADHYPLNTADRGRRALLDYMRRTRSAAISPEALQFEPSAPDSLEDAFRGRLFDRTEFDAHRIDIEAVLNVDTPNGGIAQKSITTLWLLVEIETRSRAILSWCLRVGRGYNNLDVAMCMASAIRPWSPRVLTIPGLAYAPGAGMPAGEDGLPMRRSRAIALDNALAHSALDLEASFCHSRGGVLIFGRAHEPRSRPIVEQLFSRLERGALRHIPGGFEPAKRLGDSKVRISSFDSSEHIFQLSAFEELLDVIVANYNATPHSALGTQSPLQFLQTQPPSAFEFAPLSGEQDADDLCTVVVALIVHGNKSQGVLPHVNYKYVKYRSTSLDGRWDLIGKTVKARVNRNDLRVMTLLRGATAPLCAVRAASPWDRTPHDETTRTLIMQWTKNRSGFSVIGVQCAISAYIDFLRHHSKTSQVAVDQLARMDGVHHAPRQSTGPDYFKTSFRVPSEGWVSLDE